jgi:hypothetical protein
MDNIHHCQILSICSDITHCCLEPIQLSCTLSYNMMNHNYLEPLFTAGGLAYTAQAMKINMLGIMVKSEQNWSLVLSSSTITVY